MMCTTKKISVSFVLVWLQLMSTHHAHSFSVISAGTTFFPSPLERQEKVERMEPIAFRIRSTVESDVQDISDVWARCICDPHQERGTSSPRFSFRRRMTFLKSKADIEQLLLSRLKTIRAGEKTMKECSILFEDDSLSESERLRFLWSNDRFRSYIERAAKLSNEPHRWHQYNLACAPESIEYLQHKMFTAEDTRSGALLGFCEVAMLQDPTKTGAWDGPETTVQPALVNLVVNPSFRRRGVASRIIRSAQNFVAKKWSAESLNLYVNPDNYAAITLYRGFGFQKRANAQASEVETVQCYMSLPLRSGHSSRRVKRYSYKKAVTAAS